MGDTVVITTDDDANDADAVADAVTEVAETVADAVADAADDDSDAETAVDKVVDLNHEQRITRLEEQLSSKADRSELDSIRQTLYATQDDALDALAAAEAALDDAAAATDPGEVEAMIEGTEVVETEDGETVLDAPSDVPPPGASTHWAFADRKDLSSRIAKIFKG